MDDEAAILWQDVLDEIVAGRPDNTACPHCGHRPLTVTQTGPRTRVGCDKCGKFIEGSFGAF